MATTTDAQALGDLLAVIRKALELYPKSAVEQDNRNKARMTRNASEFYVDMKGHPQDKSGHKGRI
jgi:hypothetical protein